MTNDEINEAVARQLGWGKCSRLDAIGWHRSLTPMGNHLHEALPSYATDIAAAWGIVERMLPEIAIWNDRGFWGVSRMDFNGLGETLAEAETAPLAICEAFLKFDEKEVQ